MRQVISMEAGKLNIVNVSRTGQALADVEFHARLKNVKYNLPDYRLHCLDLSTAPDAALPGEIQDGFVYFHLNDITLLSPLRDVFRSLKRNNCLLLIGGSVDITIYCQELLEEFKEVDAVVCSPEFDNVLAQFQGKNIGDIDKAQIKGLAFRMPGGDKEVVCSENPPISADIDGLSSTELFLHGPTDREWYPVIVSLGCRYNCQYCGFQFLYMADSIRASNTHRKKTAKTIVDEMEFLHSKGIRKFSFFCHQFLDNDDEFPKYIRKLREEILIRNLDISFHFSAKPALICQNGDSLALLKESGLARIEIGLDSGLSRFHDMYKTGSTVQDCRDALKYMSETKTEFDAFFVFYDPYLTLDELKQNLDFIAEIKKYYSHLSVPFSLHLDTRIFNSTLTLRYGMPIIDRLRRDKLLVEKTGFMSHPVAKFQDRQVVFVYSIYRALNELILKKIRHFFHDRETVRRFPFLDTLPLQIMENIYLAVKENRYVEIKDYALEAEKQVKNALKPFIVEMDANFPQYSNKELENEILNE